MSNLKYFQGALTLSDAPEDMNRMNYGLVDLVTNEFHSITDELERIYNSNNKVVRIALRKFNDNHSLHRMGVLHRGLDKHKVECWWIGSFPFEQELDEYNRNGAVDMEIYIEDFIGMYNENRNNIDGFTTVISDTTEDVTYDTTSKSA